MIPISERLLSPKLLNEKDSSYESVKELHAAVSQDECKNIAVTGIYGAGKSSVINTFVSEFEKNNPKKRLLRISLSTFDLDSSEKSDEIYENEIEYKLVQQILYRSNPDELYQSSFKRIPFRPVKRIVLLSWHIILSIVALTFLFEPSFLSIDSIEKIFIILFGGNKGVEWVSITLDLISLGWLVYIAYRVIYWGIKRASTISALKLKAKGVEVEFSKESSVFSKTLEEIYYFFRAGEYDVVVIEDLDRLRNPAGLFLKIRELSVLLNESYAFRSENKIVKFVYAVRDDLFESDIRVKFFDYIIPVVPVIDSYNAADYIIENRPDIYRDNTVFKQDIPEIAFFIKEMRVLKSVLNEFEVYKKTILDGHANVSDSKLFAMIVYKNIWPDNYSQLHSRASILNILFDNSADFVDILCADKVSRQSSLEKEINTKETEARSIRERCINAIGSRGIFRLIMNDSAYRLVDLIEYDYLFSWLQQDKFDKYSTIDRSSRKETVQDRNFTFVDLMTRSGVDGASLQRLNKLRDELQLINSQKSEIDKELAHKRASSFKEILMGIDGDVALLHIKERVGGLQEELYEFILSMLRKGYIAEDYHSYISFYYEGTVSNRDRDFINAVLQGRTLSFDYQLDNPQEVRRQLEKEDNYSGNSILNYSFIQYLAQSKDGILGNVTAVARRNWQFVRACDNVGDWMSIFLKSYIFKGWRHCLGSLFGDDKKNVADNLKVFFHYCPKDVVLDDDIGESLSNMYDVIAGVVSDARLVVDWFKNKGVVFQSLRSPLSEIERHFYDSVIDGGLFIISKDNLSLIFGDAFEKASYTTIIKCGNSHLIENIEKHLNDAVLVFPETSDNEDEWPLKKLLNNDQIDEEWKKEYLERQTCEMKDFEGVLEGIVGLIMSANKVRATWENVYFAIGKCDEQVIHAFVKVHVSELGSQKSNLSDEQSIQVEKALFTNNESLTIEEYGVLVSQFSVPLTTDILEGLDGERMELLVRHSLVSFNVNGLELLSSYQPSIIGQYVVDHFEEYKELAADNNDFCSNEFGEYILKSNLVEEQKAYYLAYVAPSELEKDSYYHAYSKLICECLNRVGITSSTDLDLAVNAIEGYSEYGDWFVKIALINKINAYAGYDKERVTRMLNALGGGYVELNTYFGTIALDDNSQNRELLEFLVENGHYVNRFYARDDGKLKVTFKREPGR